MASPLKKLPHCRFFPPHAFVHIRKRFEKKIIYLKSSLLSLRSHKRASRAVSKYIIWSSRENTRVLTCQSVLHLSIARRRTYYFFNIALSDTKTHWRKARSTMVTCLVDCRHTTPFVRALFFLSSFFSNALSGRFDLQNRHSKTPV